MYLSELFEHHTKDNYNRELYDLILPKMEKFMNDGHSFSAAFDLIVNKLGAKDTYPLYLNLKDGLTKKGYDTESGLNEDLDEHMAWGRSGNKIVKKYRCTLGHRKGRVVNKPGDCFKSVDIKKRIALRRTKAKFGSRMARKRKKTMRINPASKRIQKLNKPVRRKAKKKR